MGTSVINYEEAYKALLEFCKTEMNWEFFRYDFIFIDDPTEASASLNNAKKIQEYLKSLGAL